MAQYFQVLSPEKKVNEDSSPFYPNLDEHQTVQYVIAADSSHPQFTNQSVVVAPEQLMVLEGQGSQVIIDQTQVAYQQSPYIVQDSAAVDFQNSHQQVYYMANNTGNQQIVVEQTPQPVLLNHQLMQNQIQKNNITSPMLTTGTQIGQGRGLAKTPLGARQGVMRGSPQMNPQVFILFSFCLFLYTFLCFRKS